MIVNSRAMMLGIVGRPGAPNAPTDLDVNHYVWFIEGLVREMGEKNGELMDDLYEEAKRKPPETRASAIEDFIALALG